MTPDSNSLLVPQSFNPSEIAPGIIRALFAHAEAAYPRECCGIIFASGRVAQCINIADRADRFELSAADQIMLAESFDTLDPAETLYHSHPDADPVPSPADLAGLSWRGRPIYAELKYCVIEIRAGCALRVTVRNA